MEFLVFINNLRSRLRFILQIRGAIIEVMATLVEFNIVLVEECLCIV